MLDPDSADPPSGGASVDRLAPPAHLAGRPGWTIPAVVLLGLFLVLFGVFAAVGVTEVAHEAEVDALWDLHSESPPVFDRAMRFVDTVGGYGVPVVAIIVAGALSLRRRWQVAAGFAVMMLGASLNELLKAVFDRPRPDLWRSPDPSAGLSFPSGHAMSSATLAAALVVLAWPTRWRVPVVIAGAIAVIVIGLSRLVLGVHYPSDVLGGWAFAFAWVSGVRLVLMERASPPGPVSSPAATRTAG
jgi:membrane-associated phospholipid phosphatase